MPEAVWKKRRRDEALPAGEPVAHLLEPRFDLALLFGLRHRHVFVARHDLRRHRRRERRCLGRLQFAQLFVSQEFHAFLPGI